MSETRDRFCGWNPAANDQQPFRCTACGEAVSHINPRPCGCEILRTLPVDGSPRYLTDAEVGRACRMSTRKLVWLDRTTEPAAGGLTLWLCRLTYEGRRVLSKMETTWRET